MKRNYEIKVRLTRDEWEKLNEQVERTCLSREQYVRDALAGVEIREHLPVEYGEIIIHRVSVVKCTAYRRVCFASQKQKTPTAQMRVEALDCVR